MESMVIPYQALKLAILIFNFDSIRMPGSVMADSHASSGRMLLNHGLLTEGEISLVVPNRHNFDWEGVEAEWNEETGTYQYFSFDDGFMVDVPEEDLKTYCLDVNRLMHCLNSLAGLSGTPRPMVKETLWNLGMFWEGSKKATLFLARQFDRVDRFDVVFDTLKRLGGRVPGVVLAWDLPRGRHVELPPGYRMVCLRDVLIDVDGGCSFDMDPVKGALGVRSRPFDDLSPLWHAIDYSVVRVQGREFVFTGIKQQTLVSILVRAYLRGEPRCRTTEVLDNAGASEKSDSLSKFFSGRSDWKDLIGYGDGFCWLKV